MPNLNITAIVVVIAICIGFGALGSLPITDSLKVWFPTLKKPRFQIPIGIFALIGVIVYVVDGIVHYRLIELLHVPQGQLVSIVALLVVMAFNELWNIAFFRLRSTLVQLGLNSPRVRMLI